MPPPTGTTVLYPGPPLLFRSNIRVGGDSDWYGFGGAYLADTDAWDHTEIAGAGPHGQDALQFTLTPGVTKPDNQFTFGPSKSGFAQPVQGSRRVLRWRIRAITPMEWEAMPTAGRRWGNKFIILGQPDGSGQDPSARMIANIGRHADEELTEWHILCEKGIDGNGGPSGDTRLEVGGLVAATWYSCQWVIDFSSSPTVQDGLARLYINGDNASISTPTASTGAWMHDTSQMGSLLGLGQYADTCFTDGSIIFQVCDFEYATSFDSTWGD
jgi:hypothetical protein